MKPKLTIVINALQGGGAERVAITVANSLANTGYEIDFVVMNLYDSVHQDLLDQKIKFTNLNVAHARASFSAFRKYLNTNRPGTILVFNHEIAVVLVLLRMLIQLKFRIVARNINPLSEIKKHEGSIWHKYFKDWIVKYFYRKVDQIIAQTMLMRDDLTAHYGVSPDKITVINNPVAEQFEYFTGINASAPAKKNEILFVGRLEQQKGLYHLFDAFKDVLTIEPKLSLRILGDGSLKNDLVEYSNSIGIKNNVIFDGFKKDTIPFYSQARLTVLSSLFEGFPNVLVESIFCGTPVVAFDCKSGPAEIIQDGVNGFLVEYLNTKQLIAKILEALHHNWDVRKIQESGSRFSNENIIKQYIELLSNYMFNKDDKIDA